MPEVFTPNEVAELLKCNPKTIRRLFDRGDLEFIRLGRHLRVTRPQLERFLTKGTPGKRAV